MFYSLRKSKHLRVYKPVVDTKNNSFRVSFRIFRRESKDQVRQSRVSTVANSFQFYVLRRARRVPTSDSTPLAFLLFVFFVVCLRRSTRAFGLTSSINLLCYCALPRNLRVATLLSLLLNT